MAPALKLPLPTGKLGIVFKGFPPVVKTVKEDSPLAGKVKPGYIFQSLTLADGTLFEGMRTHELVATLNEYAEEEGRKIKLEMALPKELDVTLPAGDHGLTIADVDGKPTLVKISAKESKKELRTGLFVDAVTMEDGSIYKGHSADEVNEMIEGESENEVTITFKDASGDLSEREVILCQYKEVELPTGPLGTVFKSKGYTRIAKLKEGSPMVGKFRVGMIVHGLKMDGVTMIGADAPDFTRAIKSTSDVEGRIMILKSPDSKSLAKMPITRIELPDEGTAEDVGLSFSGNPAVVKEVQESSPFYEKIRYGMEVLKYGWGDGTEFDELEGDELTDVINDSSGFEGRFLELKNATAGLPDVMTMTLPPGKIGVVFKGTPPRIVRINKGSPLMHKIPVGMAADTLTIGEDDTIYDLETKPFTDMLKENADSEARVVRFINPAVMDLSIRPDLDKPEEMEVTLPTGKLGVLFRGSDPCIISSVKKDSSLLKELPRGMGVDSLTVGKLVYYDLPATELAALIRETSDVEGRVMKLKDPDAPDVEFTKVAASTEVTIPSGKLGVVFRGTPPKPIRYKEDSPVEGLFPTATFVDSVTFEDGTTIFGLGTKDLVKELGITSEEEGRTLTFKNEKTETPSPEEVILPEMKTVILPTGKLGVSFKGREKAKATRIHDNSPVAGKIRVGMIVDKIEIPGGRTYSGMTAKEAARILVDTKDLENRVLVLKNENAELTDRSVYFDDGSVSVEQTADDFTEVSERI